jgi:hypothetical protein
LCPFHASPLAKRGHGDQQHDHDRYRERDDGDPRGCGFFGGDAGTLWLGAGDDVLVDLASGIFDRDAELVRKQLHVPFESLQALDNLRVG